MTTPGAGRAPYASWEVSLPLAEVVIWKGGMSPTSASQPLEVKTVGSRVGVLPERDETHFDQREFYYAA